MIVVYTSLLSVWRGVLGFWGFGVLGEACDAGGVSWGFLPADGAFHVGVWGHIHYAVAEWGGVLCV